MVYSKSDIEKIISAYEDKGYVTRDDVCGLDSRPYGRGLVTEMEKNGYTNAAYTESHLDGYCDYSGILFNSDIYDYNEADHIMKTKILRY